MQQLTNGTLLTIARSYNWFYNSVCAFVRWFLSSRKPCDSWPRTDRSRRTLAKNDLPSSGADVGITREMGYPYIYIYCISISRVFWRFLTFFARFWILSIFCALWPGKSLFFNDRPISRVYLNFYFNFFGPIQRDGIWFLSIFYLFGQFFIV